MLGKMLKVAVVAMFLGFALNALAEPVIIKTITPDKPPATPTQPDQTVKPVSPTPTRPPVAYTPVAGDWMVSQAFQVAKVTDEQKDKLKGVLDDLSAQAKADQDKSAELMKKARAAVKAAKDAGSKEPAKDPEVKAATDELSKAWDENAKATAARREKLVGALDGVLSADQVKQVKDQFDRYSADLATRNKPLAKDWIKTSLPGVTLTDAQQEQVIAKVAPVQKEFGQQFADLQKAQNEKMQQYMKDTPKDWQGAWKKANEEFGPKMDELKIALSKAMNEAVESALTDEQKKQMVAGRQEAWKKSVQGWVDATVKSFEPAKLTDEQKTKAKDLADAAGDAMMKTDMYDNAGRAELARKLREDIKKLLTDDQKKLVQ